MKAVSEVCPLCAGSGWKVVPDAPERGVKRCDCQLRARGDAMFVAARIPKRYEHCELSNYEFEGSHLQLAPARMAACRFVEEYPVDKTGLMLVGTIGTAPHLEALSTHGSGRYGGNMDCPDVKPGATLLLPVSTSCILPAISTTTGGQ